MIYTLERLEQSDGGTFGVLKDETGKILVHTCELPWNNNNPDTSCIPAGSYTVIPHNSPAYPNVWEVSAVPNRSAILIHNGNTVKDSLGCIIVGMTEGCLGGQKAVLNSMQALNLLRITLPETFYLVIVDLV
jgi:hypothetical protein